MRVRNVLPLIVGVACAVLAAGTAEAGKIYVGGSVGQTSADLSLSDIDDGSITMGSVDDSDTGFKAFVGYRFFKFFALEADYIDLGEFTIDATSDGSGFAYVAGPVTASAEADGVRLSALGILPIGERFSIFARFGFFEWDGDSTITDGLGSISSGDDGNDEVYGAGLVWNVSGPVSLRLEYEAMSLDDFDVDLVSVGAAFRF